MSAPGFNREFDAGGGVVISLSTITAGGRLGVLRQLANQLEIAEANLAEARGWVSETREMLEHYELTLARRQATRDATELAYEAAKAVLAE